MTSADVRRQLIDALGIDLIGPDRESDLRNEVLSQAPSRWYLTGFLVPFDAAEDEKTDQAADEEVDEIGKGAGVDDDTAPEPAAARRAFFPSSMGLSLLVPKDAKELRVTVRWGDYQPPAKAPDAQQPNLFGAPETGEHQGRLFGSGDPRGWKRNDRTEELTLKLPPSQKPAERDVPNSNGLRLALSVRPIRDIAAFEGMVPRGTRSVSLFLVNRRKPAPDEPGRAADPRSVLPADRGHLPATQP